MSAKGNSLRTNPPANLWRSAHQFRLGVDIVEIKKARKFYADHRTALTAYFKKNEAEYINKGRKNHERLAMVMAAKEAVYKALEAPAVSPMEVFNNIEIIPLKNRQFTFRLAHPWQRYLKNSSGAKLRFYRKKNFVIAMCCLEFSR